MKENLVETFDEGMISELFHENTKQHRSDIQFVERIIAATIDPEIQRIMATTQKRYPASQKIRLPSKFPRAKLNFDMTVLSRRSNKEFSKKPLKLPEIAKLLHFANGTTGFISIDKDVKQFLRAAPSGGAIYPIEIYLIAQNVVGLRKGIYHYNPIDNTLEVLFRKNTADDMRKITHTDEVGAAAAVIVLTGISLKNRVKYGERGYRFMLMEAGHIVQNILLTISSLQLTAVPIGGFIDDELDQLLGIDGLDEVSLYLVAIGRSDH